MNSDQLDALHSLLEKLTFSLSLLLGAMLMHITGLDPPPFHTPTRLSVLLSG